MTSDVEKKFIMQKIMSVQQKTKNVLMSIVENWLVESMIFLSNASIGSLKCTQKELECSYCKFDDSRIGVQLLQI